MEVPSEVLSKLVCVNCDGYLSRGPIYVMDNATYRCGRCLPTKEEPGTRAKAYEELAWLMTFPCRYQENGCTSKVPFANYKTHEETCPYRKYNCPIAEADKCDWTGLEKEILEHCRQVHPGNQVQNPCKFTHNVTQSRVGNYFLWTFGVLFLVQAKVCMATRKIYHSVRLIGDPVVVFNYKYTRCMQIKEQLYAKQEGVTAYECVAFDNDYCIPTDISLMLEMQMDFTDVKFTITVDSIEDLTDESQAAFETYIWKCYIAKEVVPHYDKLSQRKQSSTVESSRADTQDPTPVKTVEATGECVACKSWKERSCPRNWCWYHYPYSEPEIRMQCSFTDCDLKAACCRYVYYRKSLSLSVDSLLWSDPTGKYKCAVEFYHSDTGHPLTDIPTEWLNMLHGFGAWSVDCDLSRHLKNPRISIKIIISKNRDPLDVNV